MCLTATAASSVRSDVINNLGLSEHKLKVFVTTTARPNLHYRMHFTSDDNDYRYSWLLSFLEQMYSRRTNDLKRSAELQPQRATGVSGIIYTSFRSDCDWLASRLRNDKIGAVAYHAGLDPAIRIDTERKWLENVSGFDIVVATTAFGMGIDKQDVRFVIHWTLPKSFEGFYQEAGRAGRDGKAALCMLFYSREDRDRVRNRMGQAESGKGERTRTEPVQARQDSFQQLVRYCEQTTQCRHQAIRCFFGEQDPPVCDSACDICFAGAEETVARRKEQGLSSEEWVNTQRQHRDFYRDEYE